MKIDQATVRASGVMLHVTSLPGPYGIGGFGPDAYRFVDWLASAGQRLWQWLPTTPVGPGDSPYQSPSAFAGSPLMVALAPLVERGWLAASALPAVGFASERVEFSRITPWRDMQLCAAAAGFSARASAAEREVFEAWCASEAAWLDDYALFMALFNAHGMKPWWQWAAPLRLRDGQALAVVRKTHATEIAYWRFVQWCWQAQCAALKRYANKRGIAFIGDIPIYVADNSADVWSCPDLYELGDDGLPTVIAGAPPNALGPEGQRWGNPPCRWERMADEDFAWWTARTATCPTTTPGDHRLHQHPRHRHRARLVGQRHRCRAAIRRRLPGLQHRRRALGDDSLRLQFGVADGRVSAARRARPGQ